MSSQTSRSVETPVSLYRGIVCCVIWKENIMLVILFTNCDRFSD